MIWKVFRRYLANRHITANVDKSQFTNVPFQNGWNNLVKMYDLRMWYIQNSPHDAKCLTYVNDLERLHNELNYLNMRDMLKRLTIITVAFYGYYLFFEPERSWDWQDLHEPKHEINLYNELDEGGDEGDDD